jgi:hypothetical protein
MKILKITAVILALLVILFFSIGFVKPSFDYGNTITVNAPKEKCWALYTDFSARQKWVDGFKEEKLLRGNPLTIGSQYQTTIESGEVMIMQEKIITIVPNEKLEWDLTNDVLNSKYSYEFTGSGMTTTVSTQYNIEGKNAFMKSVLYLFQGSLKNSDLEMLTAFKNTVEI